MKYPQDILPVTSANVSLTFSEAGTYKICYKLAGGNFSLISTPDEDTLYVSPKSPTGIRGFPSVVMLDSKMNISFTGGSGLDLAKGGDEAKFVYGKEANCTDTPPLGLLQVDLGPSDDQSAYEANWENVAFVTEGVYRACYKNIYNGGWVQIGGTFTATIKMEARGCLNLGGISIDEISSPEAQAAFQDTMKGALAGTDRVATQPALDCGEEELGENAVATEASQQNKRKASMKFVALDIPRTLAGKGVKGMEALAKSGALMTTFSDKANAMGAPMPIPVFAGIEVQVFKQPPEHAVGFDVFKPKAYKPNFSQTPGQSPIYSEDHGVYNQKTGEWMRSAETVKKQGYSNETFSALLDIVVALEDSEEDAVLDAM